MFQFQDQNTDDEVEIHLDSDPDYQPDVENDGTHHQIDFSEVFNFCDSQQMSEYVCSTMINLTAKTYGITDPNLLTSPDGVRKMRARNRAEGLEEHKEKMKGLIVIKVVTLYKFQLKGVSSKHSEK